MELMIEASSSGEYGVLYILATQRNSGTTLEELKAIKWIESLPEKTQKQVIHLGELYLNNQKKYGYPTWHEWSIEIWGTKWNAYNQEFDEPNILWFDTAWGSVPQLIEKLSEIFPDFEFQYAYADENIGCNAGKGIFKKGETRMNTPEDGSNKAFEIMFEVKSGSPGIIIIL